MKPFGILSPIKKYMFISICFLSLFTFVFAKFADELVESELYHFDTTIIDWIGSFVKPPFTAIMKIFTFLGSPLALFLLVLICVSWMLWKKRRWEALFLTIGITGGGVFNLFLKWIFHRQRPTLHRLIEESGYSFPSGHSMGSIIFYGMLCMLLILFLNSRKAKVVVVLITVIIIISIGLSRIYLGVHYPSDVLAGYAAGGVWLTICLMGLKFVLDQRKGFV
ncbi:phosphatase PAP2 family protein [Shimazuella kribbensis]|uniref:phosphatase PAP2 family protein n=1 Tax=Shimazuella kribbensis TaxID=139808 RepID=UPI0003F5F179|nr:phosphatase PAP2 family protein [Shimazuella kribbensis]